MRLIKILASLLVLLLIVAAVLAWTLPAELAYRHGARYLGPVSLVGVRGTVWDGHADGASVLGRDLGSLDWTVEKIPLLQRRFVSDIRLKGNDVDVAGVVMRDADGSYQARDLRFRFPAQLLQPALDIPALTLLGSVSGVLAQLQLRNGALAGASGNARWTEAGVSGSAEARFSDILAEFAGQPDGSIAGSVHDDGQGDLQVSGTFGVHAAGFDAQVRLDARHDDPQVREALRYVGQPQPDGSSQLEIHGKLFKLF